MEATPGDNRGSAVGDLDVPGRAAEIAAKISVQADKVADLSKQIADLDAARTTESPATGKLRTAAPSTSRQQHLRHRQALAADDERRQAKRNSLADKLTVEAQALADLKIAGPLWRASVAPSRPTSGPSNILPPCWPGLEVIQPKAKLY